MTINDLIERWNTGEGKPFKGRLIDHFQYDREPENIGCMCAQGQVLHVIGGWSAKTLSDVLQADADAATAKLLNISRAHAILLRSVNDTTDGAPAIVLTNPELVIGDHARQVLAFWLALDGFTEKQWDAEWAAERGAAWDAAWAAAWVSARDAEWAAERDAAWDAAWAAAWAAARDAAWATERAAAWAAARASNEIQGQNLMRDRGQPFFFLPAFGFPTPEAIPPLPDNYALGVMQ